MPRRKSEYLSGRGFSTFIDLKDALPDIADGLSDAAVDAAKNVAQIALDEHWDKTPMKTGQLRENTQIKGYKNGRLGGTVYVSWLAQNEKDGFRYAEAQETGGASVGTYYATYTTPGTGPGFMKATHDTIQQTISKSEGDAVQDLINKFGV